MHFTKSLTAIALIAMLAMIIGCSGNKTPITPENPAESLDSVPIIGLSNTNGTFNATGLMGAYELTINPDNMTAELVAKRTSAIGESYIVSGIDFFTVSPCSDCLKVKEFRLTSSGDLAVNFFIKHPFNPGIPGDPPSATNRLDLDVFDLAMVIVPTSATPQTYNLTGVGVYTGVLANNAGYTRELANVIGDNSSMPYVLVVDDSDLTPPVCTWNRFGMGYITDFDVAFDFTSGGSLRFDMYLTMGYGASAKKPERLNPTYYLPEFSRKAAWKVEVTPLRSWVDNDNTTPVDVEVLVYDWQIGAIVAPGFPNSSTIYASSEVDSISIEIPGMNSTLPLVPGSSMVSGTGRQDDPLVYFVPVANENLLPAGQYTGLVKVTDERVPGAIPPSGVRDFLIDSPDGGTLVNYTMPEYATYQTFTATVTESCTDYCWTKTWGGVNNDWSESVATDNYGSVYVTGKYQGTVEFNPDGGGWQSSNGLHEVYLSKFDSSGNWMWTKTWGGTESDSAYSVAVDNSGGVYVSGYFQGTVEFNPNGGGSQSSNGSADIFMSKFDLSGNWKWTKTWGGTGGDSGYSLAVDNTGNIYVTGNFAGTVEFDPDGGGSQSSNGLADAYLSKFDSSGNWKWTKTWGGTESDVGLSVAVDNSGSVYVMGNFAGTAEFDPDGGGSQSSNGINDTYLSKFDSSGNWMWSKTWGGTNDDRGFSVAVDNSDNVYVSGSFYGTSEFNPDGGGSHYAGNGHDAYLSKFDSSGNWLWAEIWGGTGVGTGDNWGVSAAVNDLGNVYVSGHFYGTSEFDPDGGSWQSSNGASDAYMSKFDSNGNWEWTKTWGGTSDDKCSSSAIDDYYNVYFAGHFTGTGEFDPDGGGSQSSNGGCDAFLSKFNY